MIFAQITFILYLCKVLGCYAAFLFCASGLFVCLSVCLSYCTFLLFCVNYFLYLFTGFLLYVYYCFLLYSPSLYISYGVLILIFIFFLFSALRLPVFSAI